MSVFGLNSHLNVQSPMAVLSVLLQLITLATKKIEQFAL